MVEVVEVDLEQAIRYILPILKRLGNLAIGYRINKDTRTISFDIPKFIPKTEYDKLKQKETSSK